MKNLKTKDYLGKARLIASAEQGNTFTGFAGSEVKKNTMDTSKDDRLPENISFAASNLVIPGLQSRSRQQSEPPVNRSMFPPTPPPDQEQAVKSAVIPPTTFPPTNTSNLTARANSVRNQSSRPQPLDLPKAAKSPESSQPEHLDRSKPLLNKELPRLGTVRTASEPRGPSRKYVSPRSQRDPLPSRGRLFMETTPLRNSNGVESDIDEYPEELYDTYHSPTNQQRDRHSDSQQPLRHRHPSQARQRSRSRQRPQYISENDEEGDPTSNASSLSDFEILNNAGGSLSRPSGSSSSFSQRSSQTRDRRSAASVKSMRVKVHLADDTRYIMVAPSVEFKEFVDRVREKFGIRNRFKLKIKDEGDLITMADGDDWEMACHTARKETGKEAAGEVGKMEVSPNAYMPLYHSCPPILLDSSCSFTCQAQLDAVTRSQFTANFQMPPGLDSRNNRLSIISTPYTPDSDCVLFLTKLIIFFSVLHLLLQRVIFLSYIFLEV